MSNSTTGKIWKIDTAGMLKDHHAGPVIVKHVVFHSNNSGDQFKLTYYDVEAEISTGCDESYSEAATGTITGNDTLTMSAGSLLPNTIVDGSVFEIVRSSGAAANRNKPALVKTAGTNTVVVIWDDKWTTNDSAKEYAWKTYTSYDFLMGMGANDATYHFPFDGGGVGFKLPNLSCETISGGSYLYIYI